MSHLVEGISLSFGDDQDSGRPCVFVSGMIDDHLDTEALLGAFGRVDIVDLSGISRCSSRGIALWISVLRRLDEGRIMQLVRCSPPFLWALNLFANLCDNSNVRSVMVLYECAGCSGETLICLDTREKISLASLPVTTCAKCDAEMLLCDKPEALFRFQQFSKST